MGAPGEPHTPPEDRATIAARNTAPRETGGRMPDLEPACILCERRLADDA
jgi:hypothetical protein